MHVHERLTATGHGIQASIFDRTSDTLKETSMRTIPANENFIRLAFGGEKLYVASTKMEKPREIQVDIVPFPNGTLPSDQASITRLRNIAPFCDDTSSSFVAGDTYYVICTDQKGMYRTHLVSVVGGTLGPPVEIKSDFTSFDPDSSRLFLPMGPVGMAPTWALGGNYPCYGLSLEKESLGMFETSYDSFKVSVRDDSHKPLLNATMPHVATDMMSVFIVVILSVLFLMRS
ncbi:hypothetical protein EC968_000625 [Mortierella alpina]|nr:hypothetical protein EC968_000625 [Mortierella alpina]